MDESLIREQEAQLQKTGRYYKHICFMAVPVLCMACFLYGVRPLLLCGIAVLTGNLCDRLVSLLRRRVYRAGDFSNESFALIIALLMPATVDWYVVIMAVLAGVLIGKDVFGGYGSYPFNPAAVGYAVAAVSWPEQVFRYMKQTYFTSNEKINLCIEIAQREEKLLSAIDYRNGYSLYIGIPFCPTTCLYCSFTSYPLVSWRQKVDSYLDALEKELDYVAVKFGKKHLNSIYIGGGTPTTLEPYQLDRLIRKIRCSFDLSHCLEFTVEAGRPDSITREKLETLKKWDITRISINPQTMKDETLKIIGRRHTVAQTVESFQLARELGFDDINMDLIMGLPEESLEDVRDTLEQVKALKPDNLTVHSLALKRAARLNMFKEDYKDYKMVNTTEHMNLTAEYAKKMGLEPYYLYRQKSMAGNLENVGYASPGKAGIYNILIMEEKQTIVACGAGASTKRVWNEPNPDGTHRIERCENVKDVAQYIARIDEMIERKQKLFAEE